MYNPSTELKGKYSGMLEKPAMPDEAINSRLQEEYGIHIVTLNFQSSGDSNTAAYRASTSDETRYFLKLRREFEEMIVTVPLHLYSQGIDTIILPLETQSRRLWADFDKYKIILYPFVEGKNGFEMELLDYHKRRLGAALHAIHSTQISPELKKIIPQESFSPVWREKINSFFNLVQEDHFQDQAASRLAEFIKSRHEKISHLVERTQQLALELKAQHLDLVLCHSDIHGRNILITEDNHLFIVDWDNPILAPKERDLMFIGGGIDTIWNSRRDMDVFYEGYGKTEINTALLAYYRYERIIQDLAEYGGQLLLRDRDVKDRERIYTYFTSNIEPGTRLKIAIETDTLSRNYSTDL